MAAKKFNAEYGFSVGNDSALIGIVDANANANFVAVAANGNISFTGPNVSLGSVSNLKITGGTSGYVLQTDGTGNLSWSAISTSIISNGTSNVNIPAINGNVNISAAGVANILIVTGTGINVAGTLNTGTGNANVGNLGTAQILASANVTAPQLISNVATGTAPLVVTSTTQVANLSAATAGSATTAGTVTTAAQPNITSVSTSFTNLTFTNAQTISGNNLTITTGSTSNNGTLTGNWTLSSSSKFQSSDSNASNILYGNGVFAAPTSGIVASISNGNSNINIPSANGNINVSVTGNANVVTFTSNAIYRNVYNINGSVYQANTAPSNPQPGDQWYNTFNGILFEYLNDGTTSQWVDIGSLPYPNVASSNAIAVQTNASVLTTAYPTFVSSSTNANYALNTVSGITANLANNAITATTFVGTQGVFSNVTGNTQMALPYRTVTANTSIATTDGLIVANGTITITLPSASTVAGRQFYIKNINNTGGIITVVPTGTDLIDGYSNATISYYNTMFGVISISTGWVIF